MIDRSELIKAFKGYCSKSDDEIISLVDEYISIGGSEKQGKGCLLFLLLFVFIAFFVYLVGAVIDNEYKNLFDVISDIVLLPLVVMSQFEIDKFIFHQNIKDFLKTKKIHYHKYKADKYARNFKSSYNGIRLFTALNAFIAFAEIGTVFNVNRKQKYLVDKWGYAPENWGSVPEHWGYVPNWEHIPENWKLVPEFWISVLLITVLILVSRKIKKQSYLAFKIAVYLATVDILYDIILISCKFDNLYSFFKSDNFANTIALKITIILYIIRPPLSISSVSIKPKS